MMEIKKLINIVVTDMHELDKLIAEIREGGEFNCLEMEILQTKAQGIKHLLEILKGRMEETQESVKIPASDQYTKEEKPETEEKEEKKKEAKKEEPFRSEAVSSEAGNSRITPTGKDLSQNQADQPRQEEPETETAGKKVDSVELQEPEENEKNGKVLGEKFLKSNSVNDLISGNGKYEYKLSGTPVSSIRAAIGINDRFLFTRELFDGNPERFTEAVTQLDSLHNIDEAVAYLRENFKWKKNETSLKFIELVKRRFSE